MKRLRKTGRGSRARAAIAEACGGRIQIGGASTSSTKRSPNSSSGERFHIGSGSASRPTALFRVSLAATLRERCPGFLEYAAEYARQHPGEQEFLWLRFLEWTDEKLFQTPIAEGWRHALGYYATRDPRMDQLRAYWKRCRQTWKLQPPATLPSFESWRASAFQPR